MPTPEPSVAPGPGLPAGVAGTIYPAIDPHAAVVAAAVGRVRALGGTLAPDEALAVVVVAGVPDEWHADFLAIGRCESSLSPYAVGDGGASLGWLQLWSGWYAAAGEDASQWADPVVSARTALYVRKVRGRFGGGGGWSCADRLGIP